MVKGKAARIKAFHEKDRRSLILIKGAVIFRAEHDTLGCKTANQCPGELFMPALSLIDLYYSHR